MESWEEIKTCFRQLDDQLERLFASSGDTFFCNNHSHGKREMTNPGFEQTWETCSTIWWTDLGSSKAHFVCSLTQARFIMVKSCHAGFSNGERSLGCGFVVNFLAVPSSLLRKETSKSTRLFTIQIKMWNARSVTLLLRIVTRWMNTSLGATQRRGRQSSDAQNVLKSSSHRGC